MKNLLEELQEFHGMLVSNTSVDFEFENNANEEFATLAQQLQELIDKHTPDERDKMTDHLMEMTAGDGCVYESLDKLIAQSKIDGSVSADDIVDMWEPLEWRYTVDQLLEEIGYTFPDKQ